MKKRSDRLKGHARFEAWCGLACFLGVCASGVLASVAWLHGRVSGGILCAVTAAGAFGLMVWHWQEWRRIRGLVKIEQSHEGVQSLPAPWDVNAAEHARILWLTVAVVCGVPAAAAIIHLLWLIS